MLLFKHNDDNYSLADYFKKKAPGKIYDEDEFRSIIERERARADRTNHQFSLVVLDLGLPDKNHHTTRFILENIFRRVRRIDEIGWYGKNIIGIILPYTSSQGARKFAQSLCDTGNRPITECLLKIYTYDSDNIGK